MEGEVSDESSPEVSSPTQPLLPRQQPQKIYSCLLCNYKTKRKGGLKAHYAMHSEIRPFACDLCSYTAKRKHDLKKHKIIKHARRFSRLRCVGMGQIVKTFQSSDGNNGSSQVCEDQSQAYGSLNDYDDKTPLVKAEPEDCYENADNSAAQNFYRPFSLESSQGVADCEDDPSQCTSTTHEPSLHTVTHRGEASYSQPDNAKSSDKSEHFNDTTCQNNTEPLYPQMMMSSLNILSAKHLDSMTSQPEALFKTHGQCASNSHCASNSVHFEHKMNTSTSQGTTGYSLSPHSLLVVNQNHFVPSASSKHGLYYESDGFRRDTESGATSTQTLYMDESTSEHNSDEWMDKSVDVFSNESNSMPVNLSCNKEERREDDFVRDTSGVLHVSTTTERMFCCEHCNIMFMDSALYLMHVGLHCPDDPWKCNLCAKQFHDVYGFTSHFVNQHK